MVAVPDPERLFGAIAPQVSPDGTVSVRLTSPAKWFTPTTVIVEVDDVPALAGAGGVAAIVKSRNWRLAVVLWISCVLAPVIVAV